MIAAKRREEAQRDVSSRLFAAIKRFRCFDNKMPTLKLWPACEVTFEADVNTASGAESSNGS